MEYAGALLVAALAGLVVYRLSLGRRAEALDRSGDATVGEWAGGASPPAPPAEEPTPAPASVERPPESHRIPLRTRLTGLAGLLAIVTAAAIALAAAVWQIAHVVNEQIQKYLHP